MADALGFHLAFWPDLALGAVLTIEGATGTQIARRHSYGATGQPLALAEVLWPDTL